MLRLKLALSQTLLNMEARRMAQVRSASGPLQHHFNIHDPLQSGGNTGKTAALCNAGASCYDTEEWERRMMPCEQPSSKSDETENPSDETEAYCHDEASREDKDTGTSRSSSHPLLHYSTSIGRAVCSRSIKMYFVQADDALSEIAETRGPVTDTNRQDGFVMLSMLLEDHDLLETLPSMPLELQELDQRSGPVCRS
jgi:hypothetical protein